MTAPAPTLLEQATIDRLGIFDEEILRELAEHADQPLECSMPSCAKPSAWRVSMRCCDASAEFCDGHGRRVIRKMRRRLARPGVPTCTMCEHEFPKGATLEEIARVVRR